MGWLEGVLTGYADRHYDIQKQKRAEAELAAQRESQVFQTLLNSEYPEIRDRAGAGILDLANPRRRKGGIAGWMGEMEQSPHLAAIQRARERIGADPEYAESALQRGRYPAIGGERGGLPPTTPSIPSPAGSVAPAPAGGPSAALPATSLVTGPPTTPSPTPAPTPAPTGPDMPMGTGVRPPAWGIPQAPPSFAERYGDLGMGGASYGPQAGPPPSPYGPIYSDAPGMPQEAQGAAPGLAQAPTEPGGPGGPPPPPPGAPGPLQAGATNPAMQADLGMAAAQAAPPMPPAGPPLQTAVEPPVTPGLVASGLPGATVRPVGRPGTLPASRTQLPGIFPSAGDLLRQREQGEIMGQVQGWQMLYRELGDPDWQQKGLQAVLDQKKRGAGMGSLREGNVRQNAEGEWVQDLYDPATGDVVNSIPTLGPAGGGSVQTREAIAFTRFGKQGEDPRATIRRLTPTQMAQVIETERIEKGMVAAEVALRRAEAMSNAPLAAQAKSALIETLNTKWEQLQRPIRETSRSFQQMQVGLRRFNATDDQRERVASVEMLRVAFERILDPTSVVREGEYARQVQGLPLTTQLEGMYQRLITGGGNLPASELAGMVETARQFLDTMQGWNDVERGRIEDRAASHGIDPGFIFGGGVQPPPPTAPPPAGTPPVTTPPPTGAPAATPAASAPGAINWNTKLRFDPVTRKQVPAG